MELPQQSDGVRSQLSALRSRIKRTNTDAIYLSILLLCGAFVYLHGLGRPLAINDESFYLLAAQHSLEQGTWLVPHAPYEAFNPSTAVGSNPFLEKPPLAIWMQMLSMAVFGTTAFAGRFPTVVLSLLTAVLVYALGRATYSREAGFAGAVAFLTTNLIFAAPHGGRAATMDVPMLFFGSAAVGASLLATRRGPYWRLLLPAAGVALGGAILIKGPAAGVFGIAVLPLLVAHRRLFVTREAVAGAVFAVGPPLAWFIAADAAYSGVLNQLFYEQVLGRLGGSLGSSPATFGFMSAPYFRAAPGLFDPWWWLFLAALVAVPLGIYTRRGRSRVGKETLFLCWWALSIFGFFVTTGNHPWYVMPVAVPMALLCGQVIDRGLHPSPETAALAIGGYLMLLRSEVVGQAIVSLSGGAIPATPPIRFVLAAGSIGVLLAVAYRHTWLSAIQPRAAITRWSPVIKQATIISLVVLILVQLPMADNTLHETGGQRALGEEVRATTPPDATIHLHPADQGSIYTFAFYAERSFRTATMVELRTDPAVEYALVKSAVAEDLQRPHERVGTITVQKDRLVLIELLAPPK